MLLANQRKDRRRDLDRSSRSGVSILGIIVVGVCLPVAVQAQSDLLLRYGANEGNSPVDAQQTEHNSAAASDVVQSPESQVFQPSGHLIRRQDWEARLRPVTRLPAATDTPRWNIAIAGGSLFGPGFYPSGWPYGPRVAPAWSYPGLEVGPYVGYPWGFPGYSARAGSFWSNGLSLYGPPVPVYGPIPGVFGNEDLVRQWRAVPQPGFPFGWVGSFAASPRPKKPTVRVWPGTETIGETAAPTTQTPDRSPPTPILPAPRPTSAAGCLTLSLRVPHPDAEVWINDYKTQQTGWERIFESPALPDDRLYDYLVVVRWQQGDQWRQVQRRIQGRAGEVLRLDFSQYP